MNRYQKTAIATLALLAVLAGPVATARAAGPCDELVLDDAGAFGSRVSEVETEAQRLVAAGGDVRVRTIQTYGSSATLDSYALQMEQGCPSWKAPDGGRKNNLIVLMVAIQERRTGLYYGSQWERTLGANWTRIQTDFMNPRFRDGDFAGGFVSGLREIQRLVDLQLHPPPSQATDLTGLWRVLTLVVGLVAVGVGLYFLSSFLRTVVNAQAARRAAQQRARLAKQRAIPRIVELNQALQALDLGIRSLDGKISEDGAALLRSRFAEAHALMNRATLAHGDLESATTNPDRGGLSLAEYDAIERAYTQDVLDVLQQVSDRVNDLNQQVTKLEGLIRDLPTTIASARASLEEGEKRTAALAERGFKPADPDAILAKGEEGLRRAMAGLERRELPEAEGLVIQAERNIREAVALAESLPKRKEQLERAIPALVVRIEQVKSAIVAGKALFDEISAAHAESSWESIRGNGTEATNRVNRSLALLEAANAASTMERQEWQQAEEAIGQANDYLDEAESLMRSISALKGSLEAARRDSEPEIQAAQADITKAWEYVHEYDDDIRESLEDDLRLAQATLEQARAALLEVTPDYLKVVRMAKETNAAADKVLAEAQTEHEAADRLRARAASAVRSARAAVSKAEEYIEDHQRDAGESPKAYVLRARQLLAQALTRTDPAAQIAEAALAEEAAETAYKEATADVDETFGRAYGVGGSSPGGGWWGAVGGGFGGGGGSSGFGGSGGGGGGSTGW